MIDTYLRIEDGSNWSHPSAVNKIRVRVDKAFYKDINGNFQQDLRDLLITDVAACRIQLLNILGTPIGTEEFEPNYGSNLPFRLMDPINDLTAFLIRQDVFAAIKTWMAGRVIISPASDIIAYPDNDFYAINLDYQITRSQAIDSFGFHVLR